jgi:hypothetical protein
LKRQKTGDGRHAGRTSRQRRWTVDLRVCPDSTGSFDCWADYRERTGGGGGRRSRWRDSTVATADSLSPHTRRCTVRPSERPGSDSGCPVVETYQPTPHGTGARVLVSVTRRGRGFGGGAGAGAGVVGCRHGYCHPLFPTLPLARPAPEAVSPPASDWCLCDHYLRLCLGSVTSLPTRAATACLISPGLEAGNGPSRRRRRDMPRKGPWH